MLFGSWIFLAFFAVVLAATYAIGNRNLARKLFLVLASLVFYATFFPIHVPFLIGHVAINLVALHALCGASESQRPWLLAGIVVANLSVLAFFKYVGFIATNILGQPVANPVLAPLGISFYTFHMISLAVDLRTSKRDAVPPALDYAFYVTFWPQLISGPITRGHEILPQLRESPRWSPELFSNGLMLVAVGLFYKSAIADGLAAPIVNRVFGSGAPLGLLEAWAGACAFGVQIYGDFFGYTTCAIGTALCLGYRLPDNFLAPYGAAGFSDFWRRWHITLSRWIRDYLYRPLGGDRKGELRTAVNLLITMGLAGLWHGAGWNFVIWGLAHGVLLIAERSVPALDRLRKRTAAFSRGLSANRPPFAVILVTFLIVLALWVPFRAPDLPQALKLWAAMVSAPIGHLGALTAADVALALTLAAAILVMHVWLPRGEAHAMLAMRPFARIALVSCLVALYVIVPVEPQPFIYFQF